MQKWEQKQKQKAHDYLVENARSNLKRFSNSRQKPANLNISRTKTLNTTQTNKQQLPINKILQIFQLQHYSQLLNFYKFSHTLISSDHHQENIAEILEHVQENDKERFQSLLNTLVLMSKNLKIKQKQKDKDKDDKSSKISYSKNSIHPPLPNSISSNKTNNSTSGKLNSSQSKFRIKIKNLNFTPSQRSPPLLKYKQTNQKKPARKDIPSKSQVQPKIKQQKAREKQYSTIKAHDDLSIIHNYNIFQNRQCQVQRIESVSKIIKRLNEKLTSLHMTQKIKESKATQNRQSPQQLDINLQIKEIQQMYLSFDSATLSSNITNIDSQQIIQCYAVEISNLIDFEQFKNLTIHNEQKIKSLLQESFMVVQQEEREDKSSRIDKDTMKESEEKQVQEILNFKKMKEPQYIIQSSDNINGLHQQNSFIQHGQVQTESQTEMDTDNPQNLQIKLRQNGEDNGMLSSIWGNNYIASVINDFSCFDSLEQSNANEKPQINDIKNFIDLVMMAGKMQKQIPILANVYLKRLLKLTKIGKLTNRNWRNIVLITLIEASKIWDDRSLQNHSFSKVIKPYTTLEINRLQKYLLFFIDYKLNINQKQYSQSYFNLRKHSSSSCHTVNLVNLDLKTIKKLQQIEDGNSRGKDEIEKAEFLKRCMNKSF